MKQGKSLLVAGSILLAGFAQASLVDATILIDRAANNKTLTVRYEGAAASLVEMRINGTSVASRPVSSVLDAGETNFTVDIAALEEGNNEVEIRLYDADGKILGKETSVISVDRSGTGPVRLSSPQRNETVQGLAEIKVGFETTLKNVYVSFFVNDEFKILKNFPPYNYMWDTTTVPNGWHEVQAWVVDESNATFKTEKLRLFVNNPGGRTKRESMNPVVPTKVDPIKTPKTAAKAALNAPDESKVGGIADVRPIGNSNNLASGPRMMNTMPVGDLVAGNLKGNAVKPGTVGVNEVQPPVKSTKPVTTTNPTKPETGALETPKLKPVTLGFGSRVSYEGSFDVYLDGELVTFDVAPRVVDGVPISPFRHLIEGYGGEVKWDHEGKFVEGEADGLKIWFKIGDPSALVDGQTVLMEMAPYLQSGRSMVPLSFVSETLKVNVQFDTVTGHVLIQSAK